MPTINQRLVSRYEAVPKQIETDTSERNSASFGAVSQTQSFTQTSVASSSQNILSVPGNSAPMRGFPPAEFTSNVDTSMFFPYSATVRSRGSVDVNTYIRNLALQALEKAFGQPIV